MVPSHSGFFLFYHYTFQGFCLRTVIQPLVETTGLLNSWVFLIFTTNHTNLNGSTRGGLLPEHPHGQKSLILTVPGLGLNPQRPTYGSEFVTIVQGLVYDLNVPRLGLSPQRHTYGSESVPIVQGLVYDLNVPRLGLSPQRHTYGSSDSSIPCSQKAR